MRLSLLPCLSLAAGALLGLPAAAPAADFDKYLPDDSVFVAVVNVKQITAWQPFQKQFQGRLQQLFKADAIQKVLKDTGFDPLRDMERVVIVSAASSPGAHTGGPFFVEGFPPRVATSAGLQDDGFFSSFFLVQGEFDADKLEAKAEDVAKDHPDWLKDRKVGDAHLWEVRNLGLPLYVALLDKNTLMMSMLESQATEVLEKAKGQRETKLKNKQVRDGLAKMDPKTALEVMGAAEMATTLMAVRDEKGGLGAWVLTLHDDGIEGFHGSVALGDADFRFRLSITAKDADKAAELAKIMNNALDPAAEKMKESSPTDPKDWWRPYRTKRVTEIMKGLAGGVKTFQITASGDAVSVEGGGTVETLDAAIKALFSTPPAVKDK